MDLVVDYKDILKANDVEGTKHYYVIKVYGRLVSNVPMYKKGSQLVITVEDNLKLVDLLLGSKIGDALYFKYNK